MRITFLLLFAGTVAAQGDGRANPLDPQAKAPPVEFRSVFEHYRPFTEQEMRDWRRANEEVGEAGGHAGHRPGQGPGSRTPKPQPGKPDKPAPPAEKTQGHEGHK